MVRKFIDEQNQYDNKDTRLSVPVFYDRIKRSNSSLNRRNKKQLENSIERVLAVIVEEDVDDDATSIEGDFEGMEEEAPPAKVRFKRVDSILDCADDFLASQLYE